MIISLASGGIMILVACGMTMCHIVRTSLMLSALQGTVTLLDGRDKAISSYSSLHFTAPFGAGFAQRAKAVRHVRFSQRR
ncbi:hypothetical protein M3A49_39155 [Paraburkholderia sp. CNPSo 3076]|uniref:hypothetical protein n=1 Tax=Paraburkholderia sp. CNPSo 3076 TaxID=2940936 RepID=UPI00224CE7A1|nr:hypothetical protein [Paraburkholderia sp. CNPSo 3076]MCX5545383.1 hypothetical protein [Paraburkholderia sp. CNPSo 3076]